MTVRFGNYRLLLYLFVFGLTATVLGLSAKFAQVFLPDFHHDFIILALVASSLTIFVFIIMFSWSQAMIEVVVLLILAILWLAVGCTAADMIGQTECYSLGSQTTATKDNGSTSAREYCYQMKVIESFSFAIFVTFILSFFLVIALASRSKNMGNHHAWSDPIQDLPWFGEGPHGPHGDYGGGGYPQYGNTQGYGYPPPGMQQPGQTLMIQPGHHGIPTQAQII